MTNEEALKFAKDQTYIFGGTMKEFLQFVIDKLENSQDEVEITNEDIQEAIKAGFNEGYEMAKGKFIQLLEKWADGYCYIEILTEDAIKAVEGMGGKDNV